MSDPSDKRPAWMGQASRWLLALGIAGSALAVGTVHTVTLCVVTVVLAAAAVLGVIAPYNADVWSRALVPLGQARPTVSRLAGTRSEGRRGDTAS
jgi:hypothetical protein